MHLSYCAFFAVLVSSVTEAFFLHGDKSEPLLFCVKICPLYCSPRKRRDVGPSYIYWDEPPPYVSDEDIHGDFIAFHDPYFFCKPPKKPTTTTTTTTVAPTTEEPTFICILCLKKCNYPKKT